MIEQEFEQTKNFLKRQMPAYLKKHGLNPDASFPCPNPEHRDHSLSMIYDPRDLCVHCRSCGISYDIFALAGIHYRLQDYVAQFCKVHELFLGPVPYSLQEYLKKKLSSTVQRTFSTHPIEDNLSPRFEIEGGDRQNMTSSPSPKSFQTQNATFDLRPVQTTLHTSQDVFPANDGQNVNTVQDAVFGPSGLSFGPNNGSMRRGMFSPFSPDPDSVYRPKPRYEHIDDEQIPAYDFSDYYQKCHAALGKTDYLRLRGISNDVAERFNLGYDDNFVAGADQYGSQLVWQALVIPTSKTCYTVRNTDPLSKDRFRKNGRFQFFNQKALNKTGAIFITEGEMDALSLETLGYHAISLGGCGNVHAFLDLISNDPEMNQSRTFYICLDEDTPGQDAARELTQGLYQQRLPYKRLNLCFPYKDINEALMKDKATLKERLASLDSLLAYSLTPLPREVPPQKFLQTSEDFSHLKLSAALYTLCLRPQTARRLIAGIIDDQVRNIVYAGTVSQWNYLASLVKHPQDSANDTQNGVWLNAKLLALSSENPAEDILKGLTACKLQGDDNFTVIADLTAMPLDLCLNTAAKLGEFASELRQTILAVCNLDASRYVEALALQNIDITLNSNGDFCCDTLDPYGKQLNFLRFGNN